MGTTYTSAVGAPPVCTSLAFYAWLNRLRDFRLNEIPRARTTTYFVSKSTHAGGRTPSDTLNDGRDGIGFNLSGATYTASSRTITSTNSFTSYTWTAGDLIYVNAGMTVGLYKIASRTDASNIVLTAAADSAQGTLAAPGANATGVASSTGPYLTTAQAQTVLGANVRIRYHRGDTWVAETAGLSSSASHWTVDDFGDTTLPKPNLTQFQNAYSTAGWSLTSNLTVATPASAPTATPSTAAGAIAAGTYTLAITWYNGAGKETATSPTQSATLGATGEITVTAAISLPSTAAGMNVYLLAGGSVVGQVGTVAGTNTLILTSLTATAPVPYTNATAATATYQRSETNDVAWLREVLDVSYPLWKTGTNFLPGGNGINTPLGQVEANPGTFWIDTTNHILYLHPRTGAPAPSTASSMQYEAVYSNTVSAVRVITGADDVRIESLRVDGFSVNSASDVNLTYPIRLEHTGTASVLLVGDEAYFGSYHNMGANNAGSGAITTMINCRAGRQIASTATNIVAYAGTGGQEALFYQCETIGGCLRDDTRKTYDFTQAQYAGNGQPILMHTGSGTIGLGIYWRCSNTPDQWQENQPSSMNNAPAYTDLANARALVVEDNFLVRQPTAMDAALAANYGLTFGQDMGGANVVVLNSWRTLRGVSQHVQNAAGSYSSQSGTLINCRIVADSRLHIPDTTLHGDYLVQDYTAWTQYWYNCSLDYQLGGVGGAGVIYLNWNNNNSSHIATAGAIMNSVLKFGKVRNGGLCILSFNNQSSNAASFQNNNAYSGLTQGNVADTFRGSSNDPNGIYLGDHVLESPTYSSALRSTTPQKVSGGGTVGYALEFDANWNKRDGAAPCIGPLEYIHIYPRMIA